MELKILKPRKSLNKAFLKLKPNRSDVERFKINLLELLNLSNNTESEEYHKNLIAAFLNRTYYYPNYFINTKGRNDLVIYNGKNSNSNTGVIIEAKKPTNKAEMLSCNDINTKAFHELILYYLRERITEKNLDIKHIVATNINEWFIFETNEFEKHFSSNKHFVKQFTDFEAGRLSGKNTDFFYNEIAKPFVENIKSDITLTYFNIKDYEKPLLNKNREDDIKLIALYKLMSPEHLLKLPFSNDSNSLDKRFYAELLHIIGLTETKVGNKRIITRKPENERNYGSILENAIIQLDSLDKLSRIENLKQYGNTNEERLFAVGLELTITWINRILFLKLLEAQLLKYHKGNKEYSFLNLERIRNFDDLNTLFFQVLAKKQGDRNKKVKDLFEKVPYLNSSLFEPNELEHTAIFISNLTDDDKLPIIKGTVLKDNKGKKCIGEIETLQYLFEFLDAYDFSSEGSEDIQEDNKTLINASVLGLIFEKINGYKDGSFFTPGFITMYMSRETIRRAVVQRFNEIKGWDCKSLDDLYNKIDDRIEANNIINSIKICDPAVGSGHFLVSSLNEIITIKNDLKVLQDRNGKRLKEYHVEVVNDELIVTDDDGELFEYNPNSKESQRVQETLFHEKQVIIENCLFGVDINPNSVKICRLRLWIELLKNAYYATQSSSPVKGRWPQAGGVENSNLSQNEFETTPNNYRSSNIKLNNLPYLKTFRKELRNNLTPAEAKLWTLLKGKGLDGRKFRRQHSVGNYILDFYCPSERIAIELDGQGHFEATQAEYDRERDLFLEFYEIKVLRFENKVVWDNPDGLIEQVREWFGKQPPRPADTPPQKGGEQLELQTLPNIDINIKCGNSLISRFRIDADLKQALKKSKWSIDMYRVAVQTYRNAVNKEQKHEMEKLIKTIKSDFRTEIAANSKELKELNRWKGELFSLTNQNTLFELTAKQKKEFNKNVKTLTEKIKKQETLIEEIKNNQIYENAFEWRFEFPEVLNDDGDFVGFDVVIGNPPFGRYLGLDYKIIELLKQNDTYGSTGDIAEFFIRFVSKTLLKKSYNFSFVVPKGLSYVNSWSSIRDLLLNKIFVKNVVDTSRSFDEAAYEMMIFVANNLSSDYVNAGVLSESFSSINPIPKELYRNGIFFFNIPSNSLSVIEKVKKNSTLVNDYYKCWYGKGGMTPKINKNGSGVKVLTGKEVQKFYFKDISDKWYIDESFLNDIDKERIDSEKVVVQDIVAHVMYPRPHIKLTATLDSKSQFCFNTLMCFSSLGNLSNEFLVGLINSRFMSFYYYYFVFNQAIRTMHFMPGYADKIPIPRNKFDDKPIKRIVLEILRIKDLESSSDTSFLEAQIDQLVYELYELTEEEIRIVEDSFK